MTGPRAALIRHGAYHQRVDTPSALQPYPLTEEGEAQARRCGEELAKVIERDGLVLHGVVFCSRQLRAWQTAQIACEVLIDHGHKVEVVQTPALAERSVGSAANLTLDEIERILEADPRFEMPPPGWKSDSDYCLPLQGAESLMMAGVRVASLLKETLKDRPAGSLTLFFGHGASFRHAAHLLGVLTRDEISRFSMYRAKPLQLCHNPDGTWAHSGGKWKIRQAKENALD
ncbi:histidine phosphatase family protein [Roseibium sp.]|uniref:histidine phosphatase family protein n=1 Tax=Roseibium sp. TaxID=1936156 RepID=UPI0039EF0FA5